MSDLATVRAEIKTWERSFKDSNGRAPTLEDIRANNVIAAKYKSYKRLSKTTESSNASQSYTNTSIPSTPPRSSHPRASTSILRSTSRVVEPTVPLAAFNPFSLQKKPKGKGKDREANYSRDDVLSESIPDSQSASRAQKEIFSPGLVPIKGRMADSETTSTTLLSYGLPLPASPTSAVSRARKRLRGEPVSPSPNKDKRRRVSSQTTLPFPRLTLEAQSNDEDKVLPGSDSSFVDNSPIKAPKVSKAFPALFEHDIVPTNLFGVKSDLEMINVDSKNHKTANNKKPPNPVVRKESSTRAPNLKKAPQAALAGHSKPSTQKVASQLLAPSFDLADNDIPSEPSSNRSSVKRALSEDNDSVGITHNVLRAKSPLLPPSPPPAKNNPAIQRNGKVKSYLKGNAKGRKKTKLDNELMEDDDSDGLQSGTKLRLVNRHEIRNYHASSRLDEDGTPPDSDPNLDLTRFAPPRAVSPNNAQLKVGDVEIDLPEKLRNVLALDVASRNQVFEEDRLVKGLLYGRRVTHYDANKGGEIWNIGEDDQDPNDEHGRYTEGEDDWEGEPVPWEVGEL